MQETLGILLYAPWIYVLVALCTLLDVFVPVLPSGALVVTAATFAAGAAADVAGLSTTSTIANMSRDWAATRLLAPKGAR